MITVDLDCQQSQQPELLPVKIWTFLLQPSHGFWVCSQALCSQKHYKNKKCSGRSDYSQKHEAASTEKDYLRWRGGQEWRIISVPENFFKIPEACEMRTSMMMVRNSPLCILQKKRKEIMDYKCCL